MSHLLFPDLQWCKIVDGLKSVPIFEIFLNVAKDLSEDFLEICKRKGDFKVTNASIGSIFISKWPGGEYKTSIRFFDDDDTNIENFTFYSLITN